MRAKMMDDLISRAAVLDAIEALQHSPWYGDEKDTAYHHRYLTRKEAVEIVRDLAVKSVPAVDAAPVVHGRWMNIPDKPEWDQKMCSVCGDYFCCQANYCPNCGAKMDGERRDDNGSAD